MTRPAPKVQVTPNLEQLLEAAAMDVQRETGIRPDLQRVLGVVVAAGLQNSHQQIVRTLVQQQKQI